MKSGTHSLLKNAASIALGALLALAAAPAQAEISVGDSLASVLEELGKPSSEMKAGPTTVLNYDDLRIRFSNGKVVAIDRLEHYAVSVDQEAQAKILKAQQESQARRQASITKNKVQVLRNNGAREDIQALIVPGQITVIDFFADWCGPCREISPKLESLAKNNDQVYLRKIDIVDWNSPIVKQFGLRSIPSVFVIGRDGKPMAAGTSSYPQVLALVQAASQ